MSCPGSSRLMGEIALIVDKHFAHRRYPAVAGHIALTAQGKIAFLRRFTVTIPARGQYPVFLIVQGGDPDIQVPARPDPPPLSRWSRAPIFKSCPAVISP
ncbi:hypothetical protein Xszus_00001 [Xenorhabdus szentirmaii]|nr:hypothetical protein Xszus_00001 [Xenorhabdus szentirmaii]